ncbi:hypothetical protein [Maribacter ulvicola]|nr:hypothetical protein [Maribacter ulvicola]
MEKVIFFRTFVDFAIKALQKEIDSNVGIAVVKPIDKGLMFMQND